MEGTLVTGGSGFLGSHLLPFLQSQGKSVSVIGRKKMTGYPSFLWDIEKKSIDPGCLSGVGSIIHLSGAGIAAKRWTSSYKKEILDSRIKSAALLFDTLKNTPNNVHTLISASAIGFYGDTGDVWVEENFRGPEDFLGTTCIEWEKAAKNFEDLGIRVVIFRIGIVLAKNGGALPAMSLPVKLFFGAPLGNGKQFVSWIHILDLCRLFSFAIDEKKIHGTYNAVAPGPISNSELTKLLGKIIHRPNWPINVPAILLKIILGEKAAIVLNGQRVSSEKIRMTGFEFRYKDAETALRELFY